MRNYIVEGEPGIFPDPIARLLTRLGRLARRRRDQPAPPPEDAAGPGPGPDGSSDGRSPRDGGPDQGAS